MKITSIDDFEEAFNLRLAEKCCGVCKYGKGGYDGEATCSHPKRHDTDDDGVPYIKYNVSQMHVCDLWEKREPKSISSISDNR